MQSMLESWAEILLDRLGATSAQHASWDRWVAIALVVLAVALFDCLCRRIVVFLVRRAVLRTRAQWDDELFSVDVLARGCRVVSAMLLAIVLPILFDGSSDVHALVVRLAQSYLVLAVFLFVNSLLRALFRIVSARPAWRNKPIKGLRQTAQGIAALVCGIVIVSILLDKSPASFLAGLSASAAVVLLIFRDSILGFVSGIQLSANDMLKVGDWIMMPKYGADGTVVEVTLTTVKVRNWDNPIVPLPPYGLVSGSFQ
ncbi:MAG: mechanosensitive ion channel family protein, partial [Alistipes sp.]|nr:mechanosensitive ion channel family protein [Alistipes sp.]